MEESLLFKSKKEVKRLLREKVEQAKLDLIYTELNDLNISYNKCDSVKELRKSLKKDLSKLDYNKVIVIIDNVNNKLENMLNELDRGSTNAFTKLMTSDLSKTIAKTLGISLAGRTMLLLAPTIGTKALVATGLSAYGLYRTVKNRKDVIKANENNELNNILMDLETTKVDGKYTDTRFSEEIQLEIRKFLKDNFIKFDDTGYRSLRKTIYSLDKEKKLGLCNYLNHRMGKGIEVEERIKKARKKLNVIAAMGVNASAGIAFGVNAATTINAVDPAMAAGVLNGTVLGAWIASQTGEGWYGALTGGLGLIGTEVLEYIPVAGEAIENVFAMENIAAFSILGSIGGIVCGIGLGLSSSIKKIFNYAKNKKSNEAFLKLDQDKYGDGDKKELEIIKNKLLEPDNIIETVIIDIVVGYLKEIGVEFSEAPKSIYGLKELILNIPDYYEQQKALTLLKNINENLEKPKFVEELKKAGSISIGLFTLGLAAMSVYDIIKGGTFLPELSQQIFPKNNIYTPVEIPSGVDVPLDSNDEIVALNRSTQLLEEFKTDKYQMIGDNRATMEYGANFSKRNPGIAGTTGGAYVVDASLDMNLMDKFLGLFGYKPPQTYIPNITAICDKLDTLSPKQLLEFYRYFNTVQDDGSDLYKAVHEALSYISNIDKVTNYIHGFEATQQLHDTINTLSRMFGDFSIPLSTLLESLKLAEKQKTNSDFDIDKYELKKIK